MLALWVGLVLAGSMLQGTELSTEWRQITFGPKQHFFGYIGHVRTIPWNRSGRYIVALRSDFQDRMPTADDAAEIVLLDTTKDYAAKVVERTRAWNFQQGTMLYWNPAAPETQFLFLINHTMWGRNDARIYFFVRGDFEHRDVKERLDVPMTMRADGSELRPLAQHIGGHVEWESDRRLIGAVDGRQVVFDIEKQAVVETLGTPEIFPSPKGDIALSPDGNWFVNGHTKTGDRPANYFTILRRADGAWTRTEGFDRGQYTAELRIDPAPGWNRDGTQLLLGGLSDDAERTRQLFVITVRSGQSD
jgi:hypothetical protein